MSNVLVTGGAGYIGSHACKVLRDAGFTPVTVDNFSTGWKDAVRFGPLVECDLLDRPALDQVFQNYQPVAVLHFAAFSLVGESVEKPGLYWRNNVVGSLNLIEAAVDANCLNFVFSSTCAIYGDQDGVALDENCPKEPVNPYGASKRAIEELLSAFEHSANLRHVIFRYFNVAGADPEAEIGENHIPETHLVPLMIEAVRGNRPDLTIYGDDYDTRDGTCIRDYVHVMDLVDAHVLGMKWLLDGKESKVFNLGSGSGYSVREVIDTCEETIGKSVPRKIGPRRKGDCASLVSGSEAAQNVLGWKPQRSSLADMINDAWRWHKSNGYGF